MQKQLLQFLSHKLSGGLELIYIFFLTQNGLTCEQGTPRFLYAAKIRVAFIGFVKIGFVKIGFVSSIDLLKH